MNMQQLTDMLLRNLDLFFSTIYKLVMVLGYGILHVKLCCRMLLRYVEMFNTVI